MTVPNDTDQDANRSLLCGRDGINILNTVLKGFVFALSTVRDGVRARELESFSLRLLEVGATGFSCVHLLQSNVVHIESKTNTSVASDNRRDGCCGSKLQARHYYLAFYYGVSVLDELDVAVRLREPSGGEASEIIDRLSVPRQFSVYVD